VTQNGRKPIAAYMRVEHAVVPELVVALERAVRPDEQIVAGHP